MGQAVVAVGAFCHQRPGAGQGGVHRPAGQSQVPGKTGETQIDVALLADPVVEGTQHEIQLIPAPGQNGPGRVRVGGSGTQLDAEAEDELVAQRRSDGPVLCFGGGPVKEGGGLAVQVKQVAVVGDAELPQSGSHGSASGVK